MLQRCLKRVASIESASALIGIGFLDFTAAKPFKDKTSESLIMTNAHIFFFYYSDLCKAARGRLLLQKEMGLVGFLFIVNAPHADIKWTNMKNKAEVSRSFTQSDLSIVFNNIHELMIIIIMIIMMMIILITKIIIRRSKIK